MHKLNLKSAVWKEDKHYVDQCLNVDIFSFGKTKKEALSNLDKALDLYFEDIQISKINKVERPEVVNLSFDYA